MARRQIVGAVTAMLVMGAAYALTLYGAPEAVPVSSERVTQVVTMQALEGTALQMDACETAQQARVSGARLSARGSAGFVRWDDGYRVLGIMMDSREEAEEMQKKLAAGGVETLCYDCAGQELTLKATAQQHQLDALNNAIHAVDMAAVQPGRIAAQLDSAEIDGDRARGLVAMLVSDLETAQADFRDTGAQGALSEQLDALMTDALEALEHLTRDGGEMDLMLAGEIRCAGMTVWFARESMIEQLLKS